MKTSNPGILGVLVEVGSASLIFQRVGGISARGARYNIWPLHSLGCLHSIAKTDVFRTANIAKLLVETTAPSRYKFGVKVLMGFESVQLVRKLEYVFLMLLVHLMCHLMAANYEVCAISPLSAIGTIRNWLQPRTHPNSASSIAIFILNENTIRMTSFIPAVRRRFSPVNVSLATTCRWQQRVTGNNL